MVAALSAVLAALSVDAQAVAPKPESRLEVSCSLVTSESGSGSRLLIVLTNHGPADALDLDLTAHVSGLQANGSVGRVATGGAQLVSLELPAVELAGGRRAVALSLSWRPEAAPASDPLSGSTALALVGPTRSPALTLLASAARLDLAEPVELRISSADGRSHRVQVELVVPSGLLAPSRVELSVPAQGEVLARVPLVKGSAPRGSRRRVVAVARLQGEPPNDAAVELEVELAAVSGRLPALRPLIAVVAVLLLLAAILAEWKKRRLASKES